MFGFFRKEYPRLKEDEQDKILNTFLSLEKKQAEQNVKKIYLEFGKKNLIRIFRKLNSRSSQMAVGQSGGDFNQFMLASLDAEEADGSELGLLMSRGEMIMQFCYAKGFAFDLMDDNWGIDLLLERAEDRLGISPQKAELAFAGLLELIMISISEQDYNFIFNNIRGSLDLLGKMEKAMLLDGSNSKAVALIQSTGLSVPKAYELSQLILELLDEGGRRDDCAKVRSRLKGVPVFNL